MNLSKSLLHTTDAYIRKLHEVGIDTVEDFLALFPRDAEDTSDVITRFIEINVTEKQTIRGKIETLSEERTRNGKFLIKAILSDADGNTVECVWFGRRMIMTQFRIGDEVIIFGKPKYEYGRLSFVSADIEHVRANRREIRPIYSDVNYIP